MNNLTKEQMAELESLKENAKEALESLSERLDELKEEAQDCHDDRSEQWQESEKADIYNDWIQEIESKSDEVNSVKDELESIDFDEIKKPQY